MNVPTFHASKVAAILGLNPYQTKKDVLLAVMARMPQFEGKVKAPVTDKELVDRAPAELKTGLQSAIAAAVNASSDAEIKQIVNSYKQTIDGKTDDATLRALTSEIQKQRGIQLESKSGNAFGGVHARGKFVQYECPDYRMIGLLDGLKEGKVVEIKNRKRFWAEPPAYDFIQLRCYMKMMGEKDGLLLENFPENNPRVTEVAWSDTEWNKIHNELLSVCREIEDNYMC